MRNSTTPSMKDKDQTSLKISTYLQLKTVDEKDFINSISTSKRRNYIIISPNVTNQKHISWSERKESI